MHWLPRYYMTANSDTKVKKREPYVPQNQLLVGRLPDSADIYRGKGCSIQICHMQLAG